MKQFQTNSYLFSANAEFVEELYAEFLKKPTSVSEDWQVLFQQMQAQDSARAPEVNHRSIQQEFIRLGKDTRNPAIQRSSVLSASAESKQVQVLQLINAYRFRGHQHANFDPLVQRPKEHVPELELEYHDLSEDDFDMSFNTGSLSGPRQATLREIFDRLKTTYCGHIGAEYMHITDTDEKRWIQQRLEQVSGQPEFSTENKLDILSRVIAANEFEKYLHTRYVGQKRFSLEGGESLIPMLDELIERAGSQGVTEVVLGMAHRGRLNVLTNILGKSPAELFKEFEGKVNFNGNGSGDVKYHQGFSSDIKSSKNVVHLALAFNPSHLEIIGPVVQGSVRARQARRNDYNGKVVLPINIHGDAAFAGQGVVMETLQMSEARGYTTGGTVHIIINNQIGFTTSNPLDARSTVYCTEVARMVQAPIFHVSGDDPEAVVFVSQLALDYRMKFSTDVVIDMVCYRRHGHSEADEPAATQPLMYKKIRQHSLVSALYADELNEQKVIKGDEVNQIAKQYRTKLSNGECVASKIVMEPFEKPFWVDWEPYVNADENEKIDTSISEEETITIMDKLCKIPKDVTVHPQVRRIVENRIKMARGEIQFDWGFAETLAYAALLQAGTPVRISGQDCGRGTFFHRHATIHDQLNGSYLTPLQQISNDQAEFTVVDSLLSEEAVLAFEYGYSSAAPYALVIWEAQFGDFANGAQVVIDQFICAGQSKWSRLSGLVMLLPHGFDGQGPEHSSARLERYLQLCAENNMQVCVPSEPAQMFHLLRRQSMRKMRRPLIVMSPKSLLRHKLSTSQLSDLTKGNFRHIIIEPENVDVEKLEKVVLCSGKVYFDLLDAKHERKLDTVTIVRVEQLYPFPKTELKKLLKRYQSAKSIVWCQEEPMNQGGWQFVAPYLQEVLGKKQQLKGVGRPASASPAVGYYQKHLQQLQQLLNDALD